MKPSQAATLLSKLKGRTLITFQSVADMDAVASAIALAKLPEGSQVRATGEVNAQAKAVLKFLGLSIPKLESLDDYDNIVIVDASSADSLGDWAQRIEGAGKTLAIIDHHAHSQRMKARIVVEQPSRSSTCEIVFEMLNAQKVRVDKKTALLLAAGIASDTAFWKSADDSTFVSMGRLLELAGKSRKDYSRITSLLVRPPNLEMARKLAQCAGRATIAEKGGVIVGTSQADSFYLQCAVALVQMGCDYAFVADAKKGIVLAARSDRGKKSVGKMMEEIGKAINGSGGGHEKVGGARGSFADAQEVLELAQRLALE